MSAYVKTNVQITDASLYRRFLERVTSTVESHGGRFVVRGGRFEVIEGDWMPKRIAVLEFDNTERAKAWLRSPEYTAIDEVRTKSSNINMVVVAGL